MCTIVHPFPFPIHLKTFGTTSNIVAPLGQHLFCFWHPGPGPSDSMDLYGDYELHHILHMSFTSFTKHPSSCSYCDTATNLTPTPRDRVTDQVAIAYWFLRPWCPWTNPTPTGMTNPNPYPHQLKFTPSAHVTAHLRPFDSFSSASSPSPRRSGVRSRALRRRSGRDRGHRFP